MMVYEARGSRVRQLMDQTVSAGEQRVVWAGTDEHGQTVASGIYFVRMTTEGFSDIRKLVLLK